MRLSRRHRWWLLIPLLALLLAGVQGAIYSRQQSAIREIEQLGGKVVTTHGEPAWLRRLLGGRSLRLFEQATIVNLSGTAVDDADLILLRNLNGLQRLNLGDTEITDDGLRQLAGLAGLKALDLSGTKITSQGLTHLHRLTALQFLYLGHTRVGDAGLQHLHGLADLQHLGLTGTAVSEEGVAQIERQLLGADVER